MAFYKIGHISLYFIFLAFVSRINAQISSEFQDFDAAESATHQTFLAFAKMFQECINSRMPHKQFLIDDVQKFVNYPSKTTVGLATKFTDNRKFFANMITTTAFKEMLSKDVDEIWNNLIKKMKYCDEVVMDQELLKEFYDREVDQSKL